MMPSDTPPPAQPEADTARGAGAPSPARPPKASDQARVAKVMARAGLCSRRDAEIWIAEGRVAVNGTVITSPALDIGPTDEVAVDGYPIDKPEKTRLFTFHKTRGLVTTARDPEGRPTVFDALPPELPRLMTIGRLDINTEGLLLLTNDGGLARLLELPATGWIRRYRVRANGTIDQAQLDKLQTGLTVDGVTYAGIAAKLDRVQGANVWLTMGLKEGKNREIKRVLEHLGLAVTRLIRVSYGPFQLGEIAEGAVEEVRTRVLRDQLGATLAKKAGVDFEGPAEEAREEAPPSRGPSKGPVKGRPAARGETREAADHKPARAGRTPLAPRARTASHSEDAAAGPRRQTKRSATADRRGRSVAVERVGTAKSGRAAPRERQEDVFTTRQSRQDTPDARREQPAGPGGPRGGAGARPRAGGDRGGEAQGREWGLVDGTTGARPRPTTPPANGRRDRAEGAERPFRAKRPDGERPARAPRAPEGGAQRRGEAARPSEGQRPRSDRPGAAPAGRPHGGKPFGSKPFGSKPSGSRAPGARPPRDGGDKPRGAGPKGAGGSRPGAGRGRPRD